MRVCYGSAWAWARAGAQTVSLSAGGRQDGAMVWLWGWAPVIRVGSNPHKSEDPFNCTTKPLKCVFSSNLPPLYLGIVTDACFVYELHFLHRRKKRR